MVRADHGRAGHRSELATSAHVGVAISIDMQIRHALAMELGAGVAKQREFHNVIVDRCCEIDLRPPCERLCDHLVGKPIVRLS
jgi:hypothetical protein